MKIKKGQLLAVSHRRKGNFTGIAKRDFDTDDEEFFPIALAQEEVVVGISNDWIEGETVPCRNTLCTISKIEEKGAES